MRSTAIDAIHAARLKKPGAFARAAATRRIRSATIDVCTEVRSGDIVLIPFGYHGPSMAAPDYDLYYLNITAGPGERALPGPAPRSIRAYRELL